MHKQPRWRHHLLALIEHHTCLLWKRQRPIDNRGRQQLKDRQKMVGNMKRRNKLRLKQVIIHTDHAYMYSYHTFKLLLDYYRLEKSQEILEMANPVTRMLLMWPAQLDLYAVSSSVCWDKRIQYLKYQEREISTKHRPLHGVILSYISSLDNNNCLQLPHLCMYKVTINLVYYQNGLQLSCI